MLKYIFSQHLRTPKGQYFSLFYRKELRPGLRTMLKETSSFSVKNSNLKNPGFFRAFTSVLHGISGQTRGHPTICLTDSSESALDSS